MTILEKLKNTGKIIVIEKGLFIADETDSFTTPSQSSKNYIEISENGKKTAFPLIEVDLNSDWEMYKNKYQNDLKNQISAYLDQKIKAENVLNKEDALLASSLNADPTYISMLRTGIFEISIHFIERKKSSIENLLKETKSEDEKHQIYDYLERHLNIEKPVKESGKTNFKSSLVTPSELESFADYWKKSVSEVLPYYPAYTLIPNKGFLCLTSNISYEANTSRVCMNNKNYYTYGGFDWYNYIIYIYNKYFAKFAEHEASKIFAERIKEKQKSDKDYDLKREMNILSAILKKKQNNNTVDIDFGEYGIKIENGQECDANSERYKISNNISAYIKVPQYALRDWLWETNNYGSVRYFLFGESKIGVQMKQGNTFSAPFFIGPAHSPFINNGSGFNNSNICMGSYSYEPINKLPYSAKITKLLMDAKKVILSGYTTIARPYRKVAEINRDDGNTHIFKEVSLDELTRQKIPITNI